MSSFVFCLLQMQNFVFNSQQGAVVPSLNQSQLQGLSVKQGNGGAQLVLAGNTLKSSHVPHGANTCPANVPTEPVKINESAGKMGAQAISVNHNVTTMSNHPLINSGKNMDHF